MGLFALKEKKKHFPHTQQTKRGRRTSAAVKRHPQDWLQVGINVPSSAPLLAVPAFQPLIAF